MKVFAAGTFAFACGAFGALDAFGALKQQKNERHPKQQKHQKHPKQQKQSILTRQNSLSLNFLELLWWPFQDD